MAAQGRWVKGAANGMSVAGDRPPHGLGAAVGQVGAVGRWCVAKSLTPVIDKLYNLGKDVLGDIRRFPKEEIEPWWKAGEDAGVVAGDFFRLPEEVADVVDDALVGRVIQESEESVREALERFRCRVYEVAW